MSIALTTHKVAAVLLALAMVFSVAFVTPASAATVEELTAQINSLLATIAGLQSQLGGLTGGSTTTGGSCAAFTLNHKQGDTGGEVMAIQKFLNANGFTVSVSGAGSAGNETSYFGGATKAAVMKFQAAKGVAPVAGYWGPLTRAAANSTCTGTGTGTGTVPTGTGLTVTAAAQPGNSLAPKDAARVPFTKFVVMNNSGVAQTITGVVVERTGLSTDTSFNRVELLDENGAILGNEQVLNSNHQATVGGSIVLNPGQTRTFTVAANIASSPNNGEVASFAVVSINTTATVAGSLPITGAQHTINSTLAIGTATLERGPQDPIATQSKEIGTTAYKFSSLKVTAGSAEKIRVWGIRFNQSGSASASDLGNVIVTVDGVTYTPTVSSDGKYYVVSFPGGLLVDKGMSKEFVVSGDIVSGSGRTISFDLYRLTDFLVTGELYGYGITPSATSPVSSTATPAYNAADVTILNGTFNTVSKSNAVPTGNVAKQVANANLGAFAVNLQGEPVQIQTMVVTAAITNAGGSTTPDGVDIDNVTLVDQNGVVLAGPVDATGSGSPGTITFTSVTLPAGVTTLYVKGQLASDFENGDTIALTTANTGWTSVVGQQSGNSITLPTFSATANTQTVQAAALVATTVANNPPAATVVRGALQKVLAIGNLDASTSGEDIRVTSVTVTDATNLGGADTGITGDIDNVAIFGDMDNNGTFETRLSDVKQFTTTTADTDENLTFPLNTQIVVTKGTSKQIAVLGDISAAATAGEHKVRLTTGSATVVAVGATTGATASATPTGSGQTQTVTASGGAVAISLDSSDTTSPVIKLVNDDTANQQVVGVFQFTATNVEDVNIETLTFTQAGTTNNQVAAEYQLYAGTTPIANSVKVNSGAGTVVFGTTGATLFSVPKNGQKTITVKAKMSNIDGTTIVNGNTVALTVASATAKGADSSATVTPTGTPAGAARTVYEAVPSFAFVDASGNVVSSSTTAVDLVVNSDFELGRIKITNTGDKPIKFDVGDKLNVAVLGSATVTSLTLKDEAGTTLVTNAATNTNVALTAALEIGAGSSRVIKVSGNVTVAASGASAYLKLDDAAAANATYHVGTYATAITEGDDVFKNDILGPTHTAN